MSRRKEKQGMHNAKTITSIDDLQYLDAKQLMRDVPTHRQLSQMVPHEAITWTLDILVFGLMAFHILVAPYTKVEESFNLQATHDILNFGLKAKGGSLFDRSVVTLFFDHLEFPGVVPRTFVGPIVLSLVSWPFLKVADLVSPSAIGVAFSKGLRAQIIVRLVLGAYIVLSWRVFRMAIHRQFGARTAHLFMFVSACQFHWLFYAGRTLPNIFALGLVNIAYSHWLLASTPEEADSSPTTPLSDDGNGFTNGSTVSRHLTNSSHSNGSGVRALTRQEIETRLCRMIDYFVVATVLFRSELLILLAPILLIELITMRISFQAMVIEGLMAGLASLIVSVVVDSWFWQQPWMWAEGQVFYFNAIRGGSVAWGTSPWHTYITAFLPKILQLALPLGLLAFFIEPRYRRYLVPMVAFVSAYSCLGHKEWRFVVYVVPILNLGAALFIDWTLKRRRKKVAKKSGRADGAFAVLYTAFGWLCLFTLLVSFALSLVMSFISSLNYPGGHALARLHQLAGRDDQVQRVHVHIDGAAAETGCSRFGELFAKTATTTTPSEVTTTEWVYSKREDLVQPQDYVDAGFTHLLTANPAFHQANFEVVEAVQGYAGLKRKEAKGGLGELKRTCLDYVITQSAQVRLGNLSLQSSSYLVESVVSLLNSCSPLRIHTEDRIWIMQRKQSDSEIHSQ
ncbi:dolichyl-P-Man:Man(7)GlcNAc(2)-PP-dolichol alpha-1,6-mannosyltransferase [Actinomortierella wolfii]|nr:dolichyl-P-Man:Man(7)GlcNAc(2)-PP-dolichol alpha-1,6-mannosyltransferase [Actinomortierella wolfii]